MFETSFDDAHWPDSQSPSNSTEEGKEGGDKEGVAQPPDLDFGDGFGSFIDEADFTFPDGEEDSMSSLQEIPDGVLRGSTKRARNSFEGVGFDSHGSGVDAVGSSILRKPSLDPSDSGLLIDFARTFGGSAQSSDAVLDQHIVDDDSDNASDGVVSEDSHIDDDELGAESGWGDHHDPLFSRSTASRRAAAHSTTTTTSSSSSSASSSSGAGMGKAFKVGGKQLNLKLGGDLSMASTLSHMGLSSYGPGLDMFDGGDDGESNNSDDDDDDDDTMAGPASDHHSPGGGASGAPNSSNSNSNSGRPMRKRRKTAKGEGSSSAAAGASSSSSRGGGVHRSASERSETTRQRNREHARSTRRRKKMYVECLKQQVAELLVKQQQIESGVLEGMDAVDDAQSEEITIRKTIIVTFLQYRTSGVIDAVRWADLVDGRFTMVQPRTPFRPLPPGGETVGNNRRSKGVAAAADDAKSIASMLNMIRSRIKAQKPDMHRKKLNGISLAFDVDASDILVVGDKLMCHWNAGTAGLVKCGYAREATIDGMLKCSFNDKHKLVDMELTYDVMAMTRQLQNYGLIDLSVLNFNRGGPNSANKNNPLGLKQSILHAAGGGGGGGANGKKAQSIASKLPLPSLAAMPPFRVPLMKAGSGGLIAPMGGGLAAKPNSNSGDSSKDGLAGASGGGSDMMSQMMMMNMLSMGGMGMPGMMPPLLNPSALMGGPNPFSLLNGGKGASSSSSSSSTSTSSSSASSAFASSLGKGGGAPSAVAKEIGAAKVPTSPSTKSTDAALAAANAAAVAAANAVAAATAKTAAANAVAPSAGRSDAPKGSPPPLTGMSSEQMQQMMQQMGLPTNAFMGPLLTPAMFPIMSPAMLMKAATDSTDAAKKTKA